MTLNQADKKFNNYVINSGLFHSYYLGFEEEEEERQIAERKKELSELFSAAQTVSISFTHHGGLPSWISPCSGDLFEVDATDAIREFDDYDYSWAHIFFLWLEKYVLDISTDVGNYGFIFAGYQNKFCKYISNDDLWKIEQGFISEDDGDYYENVLNFRLPKLYGKMKQKLKQALVMNFTLLTGMLKDAGYYIPVKIVDSFCSMERDSIFFEKKKNYMQCNDIKSLNSAVSLYEKGLLTDTEFAKLKRKILEK